MLPLKESNKVYSFKSFMFLNMVSEGFTFCGFNSIVLSRKEVFQDEIVTPRHWEINNFFYHKIMRNNSTKKQNKTKPDKM